MRKLHCSAVLILGMTCLLRCAGEGESAGDLATGPDAMLSDHAVQPEVAGRDGGGEAGAELGAETLLELAGEARPADLGEAKDLPPVGDGWVPQPGEAGYACKTGGDCNEGYCIQTPDGLQCTVTCEEECPFAWTCSQHAPSLPDQVFICVPTLLDLCKPCKSNSDCMTNGADSGAACIPYGTDGAFCGGPCETSADCPDEYSCKNVEDVSGALFPQCVLTGGLCQCQQLFIDQGAATDCAVENGFGSCPGERKCMADGLTDCSAQVPAAEVCDALDNDCDGAIDEDTSEGSCLVMSPFGNCPGTYACFAGKLICQGKEAQAEQCDSADNDCDGLVDEDFEDTDKDGVADCLENDKDGDGIPDGLDNCAFKFNPAQKDFDMDLLGDACDPDDDNDFTADEVDCNPFDAQSHPGLKEVCDGKDNDCNSMVDEGSPDTDMDGWKDCVDDDDDNDGAGDALDCAPADPLVFPAAKETCDGKDNDCDFTADEGFPDLDQDKIADCADEDMDGDGLANDDDTCPLLPDPDQADQDDDGIGDLCDPDADGDAIPNASDNCPGLKNTLQEDTDEDGLGNLCDPDMDGDAEENESDNCPLVANPDQTDTDLDGLGDACEGDKDGDGTPDAQDCAPANPAIFPGAQEKCDGVDNDCDVIQDEGFPDLDLDGLKNCVDPDDDDDGDNDKSDCAPLNPKIHHAAAEICDGQDNNCSGANDEGLGTLSCGKGACSHTVAACQDGKLQLCDPMAGAQEETCDGVDNDCDGMTDEELGSTTCGLGNCLHSQVNCKNGIPVECDPKLGEAAEVCDGQDNDCDGKTDDGLGTLACGKGLCQHTVPACVGGIEQDCNPFQGAKPETCDGLDNNCDGEKDEGLGTVTCGKGICKHEEPYCSNGKIAVCDPFLGVQKETCDTLDNDCDGLADEDLWPLTCGLGVCEHTVAACVDGVPQECDPMAGAVEEVCDGKDNDCDGLEDEALGTLTCGKGPCLHTVDACKYGEPQECDPLEGATPEKCDLFDNDCDGVVDPPDAEGCDVYHLDADIDGYGTDETKCLCAADPPYSTLLAGDCDDASKLIYPGAPENCANASDDNCNGQANESCTYSSCKAALAANAGFKSGAYQIDTDGGGGLAPFAVYCDMESDGGGWTLVMKQASQSGYGSPLSVGKWSGWSQPNVTMDPADASLADANMVNLAYSTLPGTSLRMTASQTWVNAATGAWSRSINGTAFDALSDAKGNQTGNEGGDYTTPWPPGSFTDHTWTSTTTGYALCWRTGPWFNRTSYEYTYGGVKWGYMFNNECYQHTTDTAEGLGCCGNTDWYRKSPWTLYLWVK